MKQWMLVSAARHIPDDEIICRYVERHSKRQVRRRRHYHRGCGEVPRFSDSIQSTKHLNARQKVEEAHMNIPQEEVDEDRG
jgi:hypothetical protein